MCSSNSSDSIDSSGQQLFVPKTFFLELPFFFFTKKRWNCDKTKKKTEIVTKLKKSNGDKTQKPKLWQNTKSQRGMLGTLSLIHCIKLLQPFSKHLRDQQVYAYNPSFLTII